MKKRITLHISTPAGPRLSYHDSEDDMRRELIAYWNEVHSEAKWDDLSEGATLNEAQERVEEVEDVSFEEVWLPPQTVWVLVVDNHSTGTSIDFHASEQEALDSVADTYEVNIEGLNASEAREKISAVMEHEHYCSWFVLEEKEIP